MKRNDFSFSVAVISLCLVGILNIHSAFAQDDPLKTLVVSDMAKDADTSKLSKKDEIKKIDEQAAETQQVLRAAEQTAVEVTKEAAKINFQKDIIQKESDLIEQAAVVAKKEAEVFKKVAEADRSSAMAKKAKELEEEAEKLAKESEFKKELLSVVEQKASIAEQTVQHNKEAMNKLQKALLDLKVERSSYRSWIEKIANAGLIGLVGVILFFILGMSLKRFESIITKNEVRRGDVIESETSLQLKTLSKLFNWLGGIVIFLVVIYLILDNFGMNVGPLIAGAGVMGLAFGFGGQYLIRDLINGLFIMLEQQYHINDVVRIGEYGGLVEDVNLRITTLRDLAGRVIIIPNGEIKAVINFTKDYSQALIDVGVAYKEDVDQVIEVIKEIGQGIRKDEYYKRLILDDLEMFGVDEFAESAVIIKFRIKTLPIKQWEVMREFKRRMKNKFDELGIEIPFPHRTLYLGSGGDNDLLRAAVTK
ncbi:MAG: small-conductance mechanosensitive channel [Candidatus Omnitrophota bacterium]|jgi:small-conductance mechanosensitive channel